MARFWKWLKNIDYRNYICLALVLGSLACAVFAFPKTGERLISGGTRFIDAGKSWIEVVFHVEFPTDNPPTSTPTVPEVPPAVDDNETPAPLPTTPTEFADNWNAYWRLIGNPENALLYLLRSFEVFFYVVHSLFFLAIVIVGIVFIKKKFIHPTINNKRGQTKPLKAWLRISKWTYEPTKAWALSFLNFVSDVGNGIWWKLCLLIWLYNFNTFGVLLSFLAFFLKFDVTFSIVATYRLLYELFVDLALFFGKLPVVVWVIIALVIIDRLRKQRAIQRLHGMESENLKFAKSLPLITLFAGTVGSGKTTLLTDLALTFSAYFRDIAKKKLFDCVLRFPCFPWQEYQRKLRLIMEHYDRHAWWAIIKILKKKQKCFKANPCRENIFGYDYEKYGMEYDCGNSIWDIWKVLKIYAKAYYVYALPSSLLVSNYSIREDNVVCDYGNFMVWDNDFFNKSPIDRKSNSRYAHILDQDILRAFKKMKPNNPLADSFEFGIIVETEAGKEFPNDKELQGMDKKEERANQKNDGKSLRAKLMRHVSSLDFFEFVRWLMDEQRAMSLGIDVRDMCKIGNIQEKGADRLAVKLLPPERWLYELLDTHFRSYYEDYTTRRGDTTLRNYLKSIFFGNIYGYFDRLKNRYGYHELSIEMERGTMDGEKTLVTYYIMNAKAYADRYSSACFAEMFRQAAECSGKCIEDYPTYNSELASVDELQLQNSYFVQKVLMAMMENAPPTERSA